MHTFTTALLVKQDLCEEEFEEFIKAFKETPTEEIFVLPTYLTATKIFLRNTGIRVGVLVDYPLASGTIAKVTYEVGEMFRLGAEMIQISLNSATVKSGEFEKIKELVSSVQPLTYGRGEVRYAVDMSDFQEVEKLHFAKNVEELSITSIALNAKSVKTALHDASIFYYDCEKVKVTVNFENGEQVAKKDFESYNVQQLGFYLNDAS